MTILETKRLTLEELTESHFSDLYKLLSNENVQKYFPKALNQEETLEFLHEVISRYRQDGVCFWAVTLKENKTFIGICGILKQIIEGKEEFEIAYRISDIYWGRGYGTEAAKGCLDYAKDILGKKSVISLIKDVNKASIRVAEKNGLEFIKVVVFDGLPHNLYRKNFD